MSPPDAAARALAALPSLPRDAEGPVFPAPWAARAFALAVAMNERGLFRWSEWSESLGAALAESGEADDGPEGYWRAWLAALEAIVGRKQLAAADDLLALQAAWRRAAAATPHGEPVELSAG